METAWLRETSPVLLALLATLFTWALTALGAAMVFLFRDLNRRLLNTMLGFAAGVMIAASFWSLLAPAIEMARGQTEVSPGCRPLVGFLSGGAFLLLIDHAPAPPAPGLAIQKAEGIKTSWQRSTLLVLAITLHNIPEGLAVGVAFGAAGGRIAGGAGRRHRPGHRHRPAELSRGRGGLRAAAPRGMFPLEGLLATASSRAWSSPLPVSPVRRWWC